MTFDYKIIPVRKETIDYPRAIDGFPERKKTVSRKVKRDRRKRLKDRRSSVREGIIVKLSSRKDRRRGDDRRRSQISKFA